MEFTFKNRVVWTANGSHLVSLPAAWVHHHQIQPGQRLIAAMDDDGKLVLEPEMYTYEE